VNLSNEAAVPLPDSQRLLRPLLALQAVAGSLFGLALFLVPVQFAELAGFTGANVFMMRLAGAATLGYAVGAAVGLRAGLPALRILLAATATFNAGAVLAAVVAIARGEAEPIVFVILVAATVFTACCLYFLRRAADAEPGGRGELAGWFVALLVVSTIAAAAFGLGLLLFGASFGTTFGYSGTDDFVYRQAGAATLGYATIGVLELRSRRWPELRIPILMALTFNALSVLGAAIELATGGPVQASLILATATLVSVGMAVALRTEGR
jgi:hypothetical protein